MTKDELKSKIRAAIPNAKDPEMLKQMLAELDSSDESNAYQQNDEEQSIVAEGLLSYISNPNDVASWEEVKAKLRSRGKSA